MPIYEFKCSKCNEEFETIVFGSDDSVSCPRCKGEDVKRLMSTCGFKSKGSFDFTPSSGSSSCSGCSSTNCSTCH
ncbi:MAG: zinc ribbon domain-containing protein [Deltaproteobacteria bacterium]|nr:zinc ribbon domain-containing protein [Deltaproteobacteria bacterium]